MLAPKHVCLHANATVTGLLPGKGESSVRAIADVIAARRSAIDLTETPLCLEVSL